MAEGHLPTEVSPNGSAVSSNGSAPSIAPPHSLEAERSVLGGVLLSDRCLDGLIVEERLVPEHFYREQHRLMWQAVCELYDGATDRSSGSVVDVLILTEHLRSKGQLEQVGGKAAVDELTGGVPGLGGIRRYARIVIGHWEKRKQLAAAYEMQTAILNHDDAAYEEALRSAEALVLPTAGAAAHVTESRDAAEHMLNWLRAKQPDGLPLPWPQLQEVLKLRRKHTTVIGGWSNVGKSVVAGQILAHIAQKTDLRCCAWITEMSREEHWARQITRETGIDFNVLMDGEIESQSHLDLGPLLATFARWHDENGGFGVVDARGESVERICRHIRQVRPDVALLDHFHLLPGVSKTADADDALGKLVATAALTDCHLFIVSQLNNQRWDTAKAPPPTLRDLRNSGALAFLPENVIFVHRDSVEVDEGPDYDGPPKYEFGTDGHINVAKARGGRLALVRVRFVPARLQFLVPDPRFADLATGR